jgi:hypothetical protein
MRAMISVSSDRRSSGISVVIERPTISEALYPKICSAPAFHVRIVPSRSLVRMASCDDSTMAASAARSAFARSAAASASRAVSRIWRAASAISAIAPDTARKRPMVAGYPGSARGMKNSQAEPRDSAVARRVGPRPQYHAMRRMAR